MDDLKRNDSNWRPDGWLDGEIELTALALANPDCDVRTVLRGFAEWIQTTPSAPAEVKQSCVLGEYCRRHGFIHGAEAEELRERVETILDQVDHEESDAGDELDRALRIMLQEIDARDSLAYRESVDDMSAASVPAAETPKGRRRTRPEFYVEDESTPAAPSLSRAALESLVETLTVAQLWLVNCVPTVDLDGPKPLPLITKSLAELDAVLREGYD